VRGEDEVLLGRQEHRGVALLVLQVAFFIVVAIFLLMSSVTGSREHDMEASDGIPAQLACCWLLELGAAATLSKLRPIREIKILLVLVCVVKGFRRHGWLKYLLGLGHRGNITIHKVLGELLQMFPFILDECER
jgi:hypothetical protein